MDKRVKVLCLGDVHGTGYRFLIKQKALELRLKGYCRLNEQEVLEVEVEGRTAAVDEFIKFIQKGVSIQAEQNKFTIEVFDDLIGYTTMESDII